MSSLKSITFALLCCFSIQISAATLTVSKDGRGQYSTVQAAVNQAGPDDIVEILDAAVYAEQVTIDSTKNGLTLRSSAPASLNKPKIVWNDRINVKPQTCAEAQIDALINFDKNGALRVMNVRGVGIDGISIDGGGVFPFASQEPVYSEIGRPKTSCQYYLQHGNSALNIFMSGDIIVKNCDIANAFIGIQIKDRNDGGIFANANPLDNSPWLVVPLSGFGSTGNHLIEHNRVHDNSYGFWCESVWDLGSTIRYNLIFNNHNPDSLAKKINNLTYEGSMMCGGAILFKDDMYSPFAIYNNTFWHNYMVFQGGWRPGAQHLVFNNIYGSPYHYWSMDLVFPNAENSELSPKFTNRMNNCIYSVQRKGPPFDPYYTAIMNGITVGKNAENMVVQGNLMHVAYGFPTSANIRWLEMDTARFLSFNPASSQFLAPNWNDSLVNACIKDAGWPSSGVLDPDGSPADLGAIAYGGKDLVQSNITIKPTMPVYFTGTTATLSFNVIQRSGSMVNPKIALLRCIRNLPNQANSYGGNCAAISASDIIDLPIPLTPVKIGANSFNVTIPADTGTYGFFEIIMTGIDSYENPVTSSVGFLPYRKMDYKLAVQVWNFTKTIQPDTVHVGDTVWIRIVPQKMDGTPFTQTVNPAKIWLNSGLNLLVPGTQTAVTLPAGITTPSVEKAATFSGIPQGSIEYVMASGQWTSGTNSVIFLGCSKGVVVQSGTTLVKSQEQTVALKRGREVTLNIFNIQGKLMRSRSFATTSGAIDPKQFTNGLNTKLAANVYLVQLIIRDRATSRTTSTIQRLMVK